VGSSVRDTASGMVDVHAYLYEIDRNIDDMLMISHQMMSRDERGISESDWPREEWLPSQELRPEFPSSLHEQSRGKQTRPASFRK
jgi:hypothetical protein